MLMSKDITIGGRDTDRTGSGGTNGGEERKDGGGYPSGSNGYGGDHGGRDNTAMKEQAPTTVKKNILLDWIYAQKNNIPVTDLAEFIKSNTKNAKTTTTD